MNTPFRIGPSSLRPVLVLGLLGFDSAQRSRLELQLNSCAVGGVQWRIGSFASSDAWLVNGARTSVLTEDEVLIDPAAPDEQAVRLWLPQVDRPVAFSRPLACEEFDPACSFALNSPDALTVVLAKFLQWLRPQAMLLYLADLLAQNMGRIRKARVYHLLDGPRLVGVVDLKNEVGVLPSATLSDIAGAAWLPRPDSAGYQPDHFAKRGTRELIWDFAGRTERDLLPDRYRVVPLFLRRAPLLAQRMLTDAQLFVLRELTQAPHSFDELSESSGFPADEITRALTALYLVGAITSSPERANTRAQREAQASAWPWFPSSQSDDTRAPRDLTAPGVLQIS